LSIAAPFPACIIVKADGRKSKRKNERKGERKGERRRERQERGED
jgi:hypothetical protein